MRVMVNGQALELSGSLADLVAAQHGEQPRGIAVAVNDEVITRSQWATYVPGNGDRIEIVTAVQGG